MDDDISSEISKAWGILPETVQKYTSFYSNDIKPIIKSNYLSHLVTTIENMVNDKKMIRVLQDLDTNGTNGIAREKIRGFLASRTFRLYSIILEPVNIKRRATTRYHPSGAIIFYNSCFEEKIIRILSKRLIYSHLSLWKTKTNFTQMNVQNMSRSAML
jgi:hypothetical protein